MKLQKEKTREDFKSLKEYQDYIDDQSEALALRDRIAEEMIAKIELERQYYELEHDRTYI